MRDFAYAIINKNNSKICEYLPHTGLSIYEFRYDAEKLVKRWNRITHSHPYIVIKVRIVKVK